MFCKYSCRRWRKSDSGGKKSEKLDEQADSIRKLYDVEVHTIAADLSSPDAAQLIYDTCKEKRWQVDYLINNAGFGGQGDFARERTMEQDMSMIAVNIETPTRLCKLFLPDFIKRGNGRVLNVSSTAATMPEPLQAVYYATKAYVTSWSNALWRELQGTGVTVTVLMPGACLVQCRLVLPVRVDFLIQSCFQMP